MPRQDVTVAVPDKLVWSVAELAAMVGLHPNQIDRRIDVEAGVCHLLPGIDVPVRCDPLRPKRVLFYRVDVVDAFALAGRILHPAVG